MIADFGFLKEREHSEDLEKILIKPITDSD